LDTVVRATERRARLTLSMPRHGTFVQSIVLFDDQKFHCCINGKNGYELEEIYEERSEHPDGPMVRRSGVILYRIVFVTHVAL
jgi:hypothetical protein